MSVGDLVMETSGRNGPYTPQTLVDLMRRDIIGFNFRYPWPDERLPHKLRDAKVSGQRILLIATPGQRAVCKQFHTMLYDPEQTQKYASVQEEVAKFVLVAIDTSEKRHGLDLVSPLLTRLKLPVANDGGGTLAILDSNTQQLATKTATELSVSGQLDANKLREFLQTAAIKP